MNSDGMHCISYSPNRQHKVELIFQGEIRFGPCYYAIKIDEKLLKNRTFGSYAYWSNDSRFFAAQEWLSTDYNRGPVTRVLFFDLEKDRYAHLKILEGGFVGNFKIEDNLFIYTRETKGIRKEMEISIESIDTWISIDSI